MNANFGLRILSIILSLIAVILLGRLWMNDRKDLSFIPLLLVLLALVCLYYYRTKK